MQQNIPIDVVHLFPVLDKKLHSLLKSLETADWNKQTVAKLWKVKDVVAHLLDGNIRILSSLRDKHFTQVPNITSYQHLLDYLNQLNAEWIKAMERVSPFMLMLMHEVTGPLYCDYYRSLDPLGDSPFAVDWAGEQQSKNWMHIARDYTEKWLHQQQIRDAVNKPGLMTRELYYPFIDIFMLALPHTYRAVDADNGTSVKLTITSDAGGSWVLLRAAGKWLLTKDNIHHPTAEIVIDPDTAWKLFSKSFRAADIPDKLKIYGDDRLAETALQMVSVMA